MQKTNTAPSTLTRESVLDVFRPLADRAGTRHLLDGLLDDAIALAEIMGCNRMRPQGTPGNGVLFSRGATGFFAFVVSRKSNASAALLVLNTERCFDAPLRAEITKLLSTIRERTDVEVANDGLRTWPGAGFRALTDGKAVFESFKDLMQKAKSARGQGAFDAPPTPEVMDEPEIKPTGTEERVWKQIQERRGQPAFRARLLAAYGSRCAITGCDVKDALEAAHITPFSQEQSFSMQNGLLLRADLHTLFDLHLVSIDPKTLQVCVAPHLHGSYSEVHGEPLSIPSASRDRPELARIRQHHEVWLSRWMAPVAAA